jgi:endonuclease YncB( thermonuclease family)
VIWALLVLLAVLVLVHVAAGAAEACWTASVVAVVEVTDADTFEAELAVWYKVTITERIRVVGIDAPEKKDDTARWTLARQFTVRWLQEAGYTEVRVCKYDAFGRALGTVVSRSKGDLGAALLAAGHAVPFAK